VHDGEQKGVHTIGLILPKSKQGLVIFINSDNGANAFIPVILAYLRKSGKGIIDVETN